MSKLENAVFVKMEGSENPNKTYLDFALQGNTREEIEATFPHLIGHVEINNIGTVIGSHSGPGTVALFFWGKTR